MNRLAIWWGNTWYRARRLLARGVLLMFVIIAAGLFYVACKSVLAAVIAVTSLFIGVVLLNWAVENA